MKRAVAAALGAAVFLVPAVALAHPGHDDASGLMHGFIHPLTGVDHILAMVAVGLLAAQLGGRSLWLVPLSFIAVMALGAAIGMAGIQLPIAETIIALSVVVLGSAVAFRVCLPVLAAMSVVGFFALFHGYAHGTEIPVAASGLSYAAGFVVATAMLHGLGVGFGLLIGLKGQTLGRRAIQAGGGAIALCGAVLLTNLL